MLTAFLWGSLVRIFLLHHVTWSINSICHFYGKEAYKAQDESKNVWALSPRQLRRVVAQQPPRVPVVGAPRPARMAGRLGLVRDPRLAALRLVRDVKVPTARADGQAQTAHQLTGRGRKDPHAERTRSSPRTPVAACPGRSGASS